MLLWAPRRPSRLGVSFLKQNRKKEAEAVVITCALLTRMPGAWHRQKSEISEAFTAFRKKRSAAEALQEKPTNERLVFQDRVGDKPALYA